MRSSQEIIERVQAIVSGVLAWDMADWSDWTDEEKNNVGVLALYEILRRNAANREGQRVASRLLRSWLSPDELMELRRSRCITITGSHGGRYRLHPATGCTQRVERHGKRNYAVAAYCLHPVTPLPPADISLAHYLTLKTDEAAFLASANERRLKPWDGEWRRRLNAIRKARMATEGV